MKRLPEKKPEQQENILCFELDKKGKVLRNIQSKLNGIYQTENIRTVTATVDVLNNFGWNISEASLLKGILNTAANTGPHGRWEQIQEQPRIILDVGHNPDGIRQILRQLSQTTFNKLHVIIGLSKDKDYQEILTLLPNNATYYFTQANIPRALEGKILKQEAKKAGLEGDFFDNVNTALLKAKSKAEKDDLILICGSVFVIGELRI